MDVSGRCCFAQERKIRQSLHFCFLSVLCNTFYKSLTAQPVQEPITVMTKTIETTNVTANKWRQCEAIFSSFLVGILREILWSGTKLVPNLELNYLGLTSIKLKEYFLLRVKFLAVLDLKGGKTEENRSIFPQIPIGPYFYLFIFLGRWLFDIMEDAVCICTKLTKISSQFLSLFIFLTTDLHVATRAQRTGSFSWRPINKQETFSSRQPSHWLCAIITV